MTKSLRNSFFVAAMLLVGAAGCLDADEETSDEDVGQHSEALASYARSIQNVYSGKCFDIPWGASTNWIATNQYQCHGGGAQQFAVELVWGVPGSTSTGWQLRNVQTNKCVRPESATSSGFQPQSLKLVQGPCDGYYAVWRKRDPINLGGGAERTSFQWDNNSAYCIDVPGDKWWQNGAQLQVYRQCHGGMLQRFDVRP